MVVRVWFLENIHYKKVAAGEVDRRVAKCHRTGRNNQTKQINKRNRLRKVNIYIYIYQKLKSLL